MCSGSKSSVGVIMDGDDNTNKQEEGVFRSSYNLLEISAVNDVSSFKRAVEEEGHNFDEPSSWYGRRNGSKKLGFEERTPLMIAAMFGSKDVLSYILETRFVDVNRACGSDGATALHCAAASGTCRSFEIVKILIDASADINCVDANGSKPCEVIAISPKMNSKSRRILETLLKGGVDQVVDEEEPVFSVPQLSTESSRPEKKEYPIDPSLPDIKNGICSTDEFRMYSFKVKPCSRAYSHDWTECPFAHPGENARRRDPRKYHYSCVPCPDFRKGSCSKGDACEYAHGVFECWLHPAQYRTRLCKDEINCPRRVCFFAHKLEELRPMYASTGSAVPSPISMSSIGASHFEMPSLSPLALGSSSMLLPSTRTPPITPTSASTSPMWQNQFNSMAPPSLQLPGSRLRPGLNARNVGLEAELLGIEKPRRLQHFEEFAGLSSPSRWNTSLNDAFGYVEPAVLSQSPTGMQIRQNMNQQLRSTYPSSIITSSPIEGSSLFSIDPPSAMNSRSAAFAKRSQSFIDRSSAVNRFSGLSSPGLASPTMTPSQFPSWGSPGGKLDWGVQGQELDKLRRSASFGFHSTGNTNVAGPDVSWVRSIDNNEQLGSEEKLKQMQMYHLNSGGSEMIPPWIEQMYMEQQEQLVA